MSDTNETADSVQEAPEHVHPEHRSPLAEEAKRAIEAIVMVADEPADPRLLAQLIEIPAARVDELCAELAAEYDEQRRGFALVQVAGGWRFQSRGELSPYVERFVLTGQSARLSAAALETLSIVAYKQPISRAQVAAIRGVSVDGVMRTLQQRGYIGELARDPGPGQAILFGTTSLFLERLGLNSLDELPALGDFVPGPEVLEALEAGLRITEDEAHAPAVESTPPVAADDIAAADIGAADIGAADLAAAEAVADEIIDLREPVAADPEDVVDLRDPEPAPTESAPLSLDALDVLADD